MRNPLAQLPGRGNTVERGFALREYTPDPRLYEMMTILSPDVAEDDLPAQIETIAGYITTAGGTVNETLRESPWGRRRLAYSIRHDGRDIRDGFYTVFHFTLDPNGVRDIERDLKLNDLVMRFLITHYTPKAETPGAATEGAEGTTAGSEGEAPASGAVAPAAGGEAPAAAGATSPDTAPAIEAAGTEDGSNAATAVRAADADAAESMEAEAAAEATDTPPSADSLTDIAVPSETSDTEAAATTDEPAETPATDAPAEETPATDETPAEPTAPAKDDEEA